MPCTSQEGAPDSTQFSILTGDYLGQTPPGQTPTIFAPGLLNRPLGLAVSPAGNQIVYASWGGEPRARIMILERTADRWSTPRVASFSGEFMDWDVNMSPDGSRLYFSSRRPRPGETTPIEDADIWFVERIGDRWGSPQHLGPTVNTELDEVHPTIARNGNIYFFGRRDGGFGGADISVTRLVNGEYTPPELLGRAINSEHHEMDPFVAPDESYLIFHSDRPGGPGRMNLYISFRADENTWSESIELGPQINKEGATNYCGRVSHDGRYLFFHVRQGEESNVYWVDAEVIQQLKQGR